LPDGFARFAAGKSVAIPNQMNPIWMSDKEKVPDRRFCQKAHKDAPTT
jgi:hypothetical protein